MPTTQNFRILCSNRGLNSDYQIVLSYLTKEEEIRIDNLGNGRIILPRGDKKFEVKLNKIFCYGEVNFYSDEDLDTIDDFHFLDYLGAKGIPIPSDYDYETHSCMPPNNILRWRETWSPSELVRYSHACLGKPDRIILFVNLLKK